MILWSSSWPFRTSNGVFVIVACGPNQCSLRHIRISFVNRLGNWDCGKLGSLDFVNRIKLILVPTDHDQPPRHNLSFLLSSPSGYLDWKATWSIGRDSTGNGDGEDDDDVRSSRVGEDIWPLTSCRHLSYVARGKPVYPRLRYHRMYRHQEENKRSRRCHLMGPVCVGLSESIRCLWAETEGTRKSK